MKNKANAYGCAKIRKKGKNHSSKSQHLVICLEYEGEINLANVPGGEQIYKAYKDSLSEMHTIEQRKEAHLDNSKNAKENEYLLPLETSFDHLLENGFQFTGSITNSFQESKVINGVDQYILLEKLKAVLALLSKEEREYITLRFVDRLSQKEIAQKRRVYQQAICRYESRLLSKMRKMLTL